MSEKTRVVGKFAHRIEMVVNRNIRIQKPPPPHTHNCLGIRPSLRAETHVHMFLLQFSTVN